MSATDHTLTDAEREAGGRLVREVWIEWAKEQPNPKPSWLVPWEGLSEPDREVDRRIADRLLATAEAEKEALRAERDEIADRLSVVLCDLTGGKLSKTGYSAQAMIQAVEEEFEQHAESAEAALAGIVAAVAGLAGEHERVMDSRLPMADREERESGRRTVRLLRALIDADHAAALRAREAKVLRDAATSMVNESTHDRAAHWRAHGWSNWLRARADSIEQARP